MYPLRWESKQLVTGESKVPLTVEQERIALFSLILFGQKAWEEFGQTFFQGRRVLIKGI